MPLTETFTAENFQLILLILSLTLLFHFVMTQYAFYSSSFSKLPLTDGIDIIPFEQVQSCTNTMLHDDDDVSEEGRWLKFDFENENSLEPAEVLFEKGLIKSEFKEYMKNTSKSKSSTTQMKNSEGTGIDTNSTECKTSKSKTSGKAFKSTGSTHQSKSKTEHSESSTNADNINVEQELDSESISSDSMKLNRNKSKNKKMIAKLSKGQVLNAESDTKIRTKLTGKKSSIDTAAEQKSKRKIDAVIDESASSLSKSNMNKTCEKSKKQKFNDVENGVVDANKRSKSKELEFSDDEIDSTKSSSNSKHQNTSIRKASCNISIARFLNNLTVTNKQRAYIDSHSSTVNLIVAFSNQPIY